MKPEEVVNKSEWSVLLEAARRGDSEALGAVCERLREFLLLIADDGLGDDLRAKLGASDVVQQSLLEAQCEFDRFSGTSEAEFRAWLKRILRHNLIDSARRYHQTQKRDVTREISFDTGSRRRDLAGQQKTASSLMCRRETDEELLRAVTGLPQRSRQVIELRHRDGLSHAEIAEKLGISEVATRKLWSRAVEQLRQMLDVNDDDQPRQPR